MIAELDHKYIEVASRKARKQHQRAENSQLAAADQTYKSTISAHSQRRAWASQMQALHKAVLYCLSKSAGIAMVNASCSRENTKPPQGQHLQSHHCDTNQHLDPCILVRQKGSY